MPEDRPDILLEACSLSSRKNDPPEMRIVQGHGWPLCVLPVGPASLLPGRQRRPHDGLEEEARRHADDPLYDQAVGKKQGCRNDSHVVLLRNRGLTLDVDLAARHEI